MKEGSSYFSTINIAINSALRKALIHQMTHISSIHEVGPKGENFEEY